MGILFGVACFMKVILYLKVIIYKSSENIRI